jgi:hypothetical protein
MNDLDALLDKNTPNFQGRGVLVFISNMDFLLYGSTTGDNSQKAIIRKGGDE